MKLSMLYSAPLLLLLPQRLLLASAAVKAKRPA